ncbi:MAG: acyl carrier protein [Clostridiales bacterium]|nr:acyl carrier protein [Clostridiales bacterium]MBR6987381.1 acyl carrier protein [Clostridiales bacterium]
MGDQNSEREQVFADVIRIMAETLEISPEEITADLNFNSDLPFDSLQLYEFVIDVEEKYNIRLPDEVLDQVKTVSDIVDVIIKLKK